MDSNHGRDLYDADSRMTGDPDAPQVAGWRGLATATAGSLLGIPFISSVTLRGVWAEVSQWMNSLDRSFLTIVLPCISHGQDCKLCARTCRPPSSGPCVAFHRSRQQVTQCRVFRIRPEFPLKKIDIVAPDSLIASKIAGDACDHHSSHQERRLPISRTCWPLFIKRVPG